MAKQPQPAAEDRELSFDQALGKLEELAAKLEEGDIPLEDALDVYERAVGLFGLCRGRLDAMEQRIEVLSRDLDGTLQTTPAQLPDDAPEDG